VRTRHLGGPALGDQVVNLVDMNSSVRRIIASASATAIVAGAVLAPAAGAASAGQTVKLTVKHAYIDHKRPGCCFIGSVFKGDRFKIDRVARVSHGSAKGVWYHGVATVHGDKPHDTFKIKGWMRASGFS
jgi:hypothetical protein